MRVAIVGCGFVADYYVRTLPAHPELEVIGVMDRDSERAQRFAQHYSVSRFDSLDELLADSQVDIVLNLTNPRSHYEVSERALLAGKHVYSEKPMAMSFDEAKELVDLAALKGLQISSAPCSLLGETAQTIWKAIREQRVGPVRLVYAELDDGLIHKMPYKLWESESGATWPAQDEFEVGCTLEHAGYYLTWLAAFFGPVESVTAFSSCLVADKGTGRPIDGNTPDFSVACLKFASGVVARLTCSVVAPHNHELTIVGDQGVLATKDCWCYHSPVHTRRLVTIRRKTFLSPWRSKCPLVKSGSQWRPDRRGSQQMDFARGVAEMAAAIKESRTCRLSPQFSLHVLEVTLAIQNSLEQSTTYSVTTTFDPLDPMPWAT